MMQVTKEHWSWLLSALSKDDDRPNLANVFVADIHGELYFVATDGHRLHALKAPNDAPRDHGYLAPVARAVKFVRGLAILPPTMPLPDVPPEVGLLVPRRTAPTGKLDERWACLSKVPKTNGYLCARIPANGEITVGVGLLGVGLLEVQQGIVPVSPGYLGDMAQGGDMVYRLPDGPTDPIRFDADEYRLGLLMPVRV